MVKTMTYHTVCVAKAGGITYSMGRGVGGLRLSYVRAEHVRIEDLVHADAGPVGKGHGAAHELTGPPTPATHPMYYYYYIINHNFIN